MSNRAGNAAFALFVALYTGSVLYLDNLGAFPIEEALTIAVVLGIGFSFIAWALTIGIKPLELQVPRPPAQTIVALILVAGIAAYLVSGRSWIDELAPPTAEPDGGFAHMVAVLAGKLAVFVAAPFLVFRILFGHRWADFGMSRAAWARLLGRDGLAVVVIGGAICVFQYFAGRAAAPIREGQIAAEALWVGLPLAFAWLTIEVGLVEEFFFRAVLQTRLAALFKSEIAGLFLMVLIFGLVHAPGMVLRGAGGVEGLGEHPAALTAAAYTIAVQSVAGLFLGIVWMRTRNLPAVMLIHAAGDLLSNAPDFMGAIGLTR